jgi:hypothetical protein
LAIVFPSQELLRAVIDFFRFATDSAARRQEFIYQYCGSLQQLRARSLIGTWRNVDKILFEADQTPHLARENCDFAAKTPC